MCDIPKTSWPTTYLSRLQAVTSELRAIGAPSTLEVIAQRFTGSTTEEVESTLAALVLFGRVEKNGELYSAVDGA